MDYKLKVNSMYVKTSKINQAEKAIFENKFIQLFSCGS
jgi:hypothetical protein